MSLYNSLYEREGHGISPNEPEKKGFAMPKLSALLGKPVTPEDETEDETEDEDGREE